ncbi:hypothetical protein IEU95_00550 [Hoyosella rhizosphaerae]|nr:hypothetical protein [Hoyosella rhizosphaerae]
MNPRIATLADPDGITGSTTLERLESAVERHTAVTELLVDHVDRRGLFSVGLDAVEHAAVMPMQRNEHEFVDQEWAARLSLDLLTRYLANLHAEMTGAPVEPQWQRFFELASDCSQSPEHAAMAGYNAHITVDLAYSVSVAGTRDHHAFDFFRIVDQIALHGNSIIDSTRSAYGADLGPLWSGFFIGDAVDSVVGEGVGTTAMLRIADVGYNSLTLAHGFALQHQPTEVEARHRIHGLWGTIDQVLGGLNYVGSL